MKYSLVILLLLLFSCANPKPRKPVSHTGRINMSESVNYNRQLNKKEEALIKAYIAKDSLHDYIASQYGFWYTYISKNDKDSIYPKKGDEVLISYEIKSFNDSIIYSKEEVGNRTYLVDQQDFMKGLQEGIKLMKKDEKIVYLLPSIKAYGVYGDQKKIGSNIPIIVNLELIEIRK